MKSVIDHKNIAIANGKAAFTALVLALSSSAFGQADQEVKAFTLDGEFGFIVTTGNTETTSISAGLAATQELEKWSNSYNLSGLYKSDSVVNDDGEDEDQTTAQKFFASAQGNYKLANPNYRLFGFGSYEDDRFSNFDFQGTLAAGWNHLLWDNATSSFEYSVGPGYSYAKTLEDETINGVILRGAVAYNWNISETAKFTQTVATEIGEDNTKSRAESALTAQIYGGLSMKLSLKVDHNTDVAEGIDKLDTETAMTLVYTFF
ncbi:MAG: DUF481 domain-containing protein [Pseudomonadota bacterium]